MHDGRPVGVTKLDFSSHRTAKSKSSPRVCARPSRLLAGRFLPRGQSAPVENKQNKDAPMAVDSNKGSLILILSRDWFDPIIHQGNSLLISIAARS